ncbi:hypothetical protein H5232_11090 [Pseudoalteromonas sp. SG41-5]|uniref:hypothetical protein n=1 Tax=Pseudoalteromonas sp. SG41-5 TaxID=2760975 RepID=UPI0016017AE2|nr:hypothetical protein [Pseudoalteromonas sp. SG41-5]MBB1468994.1 hypothetical protein [Pseudoalteromonas sp. SG41-5]
MSLNDIRNQIQSALKVFLIQYSYKDGGGINKNEMNDIGLAIFTELNSAIDTITELGFDTTLGLDDSKQITIPADEFFKNEVVRQRVLKNNPQFTIESLTQMADVFINPITGDVFKKHASLRV